MGLGGKVADSASSRSNFYSSARQLLGISVASSHHEALLVAVSLLISHVTTLSPRVVDRFFALYTLMMQMAFSNIWGWVS